MITEPMTAERAEELRRQIAAMLFFAMPRNDDSEDQKFDRYQSPIRGLLHCLDILDGKSDSGSSTCEGCHRVLTPEMPRLVCEDGPELCIECMPDEHRRTPTYGYCAEDADRDIERARRWVAELMQEDPA
ncbi:hypothetical protein NKH73_13990 [Mesorhizobium sp. M0938]|uniref:hypothetical protein n=1 Tax=unclassified Mesorhizobium TaxID=325217 RepID=UPI00333C978E